MSVCLLSNSSRTAEPIKLTLISLSFSWSGNCFKAKKNPDPVHGSPKKVKNCFGTIRYSNKFLRVLQNDFESKYKIQST